MRFHNRNILLTLAVVLAMVSTREAAGQGAGNPFAIAAGKSQPMSSYAPDSLKATVNIDGRVALSWATPQGVLPLGYRIWRAVSIRFDSVGILKNPFAISFTDYTAEPGNYYYYAVEALYAAPVQGNVAYTEIEYVRPPNDVKFVSSPLTTAVVGGSYDYAFTVSAPDIGRLRYWIGSSAPDSMIMNGIDRRIYWSPRQKGYYPVTIYAEDTLTHARAAQEFAICVADAPASIFGTVSDELSSPVAGALVRVSQVGNGTSYSYETITDQNGSFRIDDIQAGVPNGGPGALSKLYLYVKSPDPALSSQWFINASRVSEADERLIFTGDTLRFDFILHPDPNNLTPVAGLVRDTAGNPVAAARVSFVPVSHFIHIGDTTNRSNPYYFSLDVMRKIFAESSVVTDAQGRFTTLLPIGKAYYTVAEKEGFVTTYYPSERNVLESRAVRIAPSGKPLDFALAPALIGNSSLAGKIVKMENGISPVSTVVVAITTGVRRGGGGTLEFITALADSDGIYVIRNLKDSSRVRILAIPFGESAPLFYTGAGGTDSWNDADSLLVSGDMQDVNVYLPSAPGRGIGSIWGMVQTRNAANQYVPLPGALVYILTASTGEIAGYAVSDSLGFYSITGLPPNIYTVTACKIGWRNEARVNNQRLLYTDSRSVERVLQQDLFILPDPSDPTTAAELAGAPDGFVLYPNYPNPFNPSTTINYFLPKAATVSLRVYDMFGREVALLDEGRRAPGVHTVRFAADRIPSGVYMYRLTVDGSLLSRKMILVK